MMTTRLTAAIGTTLTMTLVAGCSSSSAPAAHPRSAPAATAPVVAAASAAYLGMMADWQHAAAIPNYQDRILMTHASGQALGMLAMAVFDVQSAKATMSGRPVLSPKVVTLDQGHIPAKPS